MKSAKSNRAFQVISRKTIFRGHVLALDVLQIKTPSGRQVERTLIRSKRVAIIVPRLPNRRLLLIRQLRIATGRRIWEFPAGTAEKGESMIRCADRELQEETGWRADRLRKVLEFFPTPGVSNEKMHLFIADRLEKGTPHRPDDDEELEVRDFSVSQIEKMIRQGRIVDGKTILGFLCLKWLVR